MSSIPMNSVENLVLESPKVSVKTSPLMIWRSVALIGFVLAFVMTALFIWQTVKNTQLEADLGDLRRRAMVAPPTSMPTAEPGVDSNGSPCPQLPSLLPLPNPLPTKVADALKHIEKYLDSFINESVSLPAISSNVFYKNTSIWEHHYGTKVVFEEAVPDGDTRYRIGSITKVFVVLLVFKLYEDGVIHSLDDPLNKYAPAFDIYNPFTRDNITIRQIASQMSGLPREAPCVYRCSNSTEQGQLLKLRNRSLVLPPGTMPSYSNLGYALLGRLFTENLLNCTFEEWAKEVILDPLQMNNTGFKITDEVRKNMALPYAKGEKLVPFMDLGWLAPAGQMYSTLNDLTKLGMMFSHPDKQTLFRPSSLREMMLPMNVAPDGRTLWGSPWEMEFLEGFVVRGKGGSIDTYTAFVTIVPEMQLGMTLLISTHVYLEVKDASEIMKLSHRIYKTILPALNETLYDLEKNASFPIDESPYVGIYKVNETNLETLEMNSYVANITRFQDFLVVRTLSQINDFTIRYIGQPLIFQAKYSTKMSCLNERLGSYADLRFEPPDNGTNRSPGFDIPGWKLVAVRVPKGSQLLGPMSSTDRFYQDPEQHQLPLKARGLL